MKTQNPMKKDNIRLIVSIAVAACLWTLMFSPMTSGFFNFWGMMSVSAALLFTLATVSGVKWWREICLDWKNVIIGVALAAALWGIFWTGDKVSSWMFGFAREQVDMIYGIKSGISPVLLSVLLLLLIGPAEEIFWRGYVQRTLADRIGKNAGFLVATAIYACVHIPSWNFMLVMAALVAGAVWGLAYRLCPDKFGAIVISHALWDAAVFVWFPV